jgi:biopolymer transport protein ExbD
MAGGGSPTPTKGGKRSVDFTVNLVPTIDLLSVLISFLLITAVWTQLARINTNTLLPKTSPDQVETPEDKEQVLRVLVAEEQMVVKYGDEPSTVIKAGEGDMVAKLRESIKSIKTKIADVKKQKIQIGAQDAVHYSVLIQVMDVMLDNELTGFSVGSDEVLKGLMNDAMVPGAPPGATPAPAPGQPG